MAKKTSKGRQKIQMTKMSKESNLLVTFSKRRFLPFQEIFSFGHPNVESIINRFLTRNNPTTSSSTTCQLVEAHRNANIRELNAQLMEIHNQLEFEKKRRKNWWEDPVNELGLGELEQLKLGMEELKKNVTKQMQKIIFEASNTPAFFLGGSSSNGGQVDVKNIKGLGLSMATTGRSSFP
ncbi:unnamed protein product [Withania somnifera]